ncbi:COG4315 family predicted lipoprotein [Actinospica robiniae]|uniref:COG4315 family predicted lipoprotein n=1 Tax=Actinospica robiniae TaxID=304901 RepID=UPI0003F5C17A|nr:hypothetical protein [Actinospica robiniae]
MKRVASCLAGLAAVVASLSGCSSSNNSSTSTPATTALQSATANITPTGAATVKTASSPVGQILVDGSGRTLYLFEADTGPTSTCTGTCAAQWPPDLTVGTPTGTGVSSSMLGTTKRSDNTTQVTYNGHPLYHFALDTGPGSTNGQGVNAFGALWYTVNPNGSADTTKPTGSASASAGLY